MPEPTVVSAPPLEHTPAALPAKLWRWWRLRSRRGLVVTGALPSAAAADFVTRLRAGTVLPVPMDAEGPEDADVVVIVGQISAQLSLRLAGLRQRLPPGAVIVAFDVATPVPVYAVGGAAGVVDLDILVRALPPTAATIDLVIQHILASTASSPASTAAGRP